MGYKVKLTPSQRAKLTALVKNGNDKAKKLTHARILLQADCSKQGSALKAKEIALNLSVHERTVHRVRKRFSEEGLDVALNRKPHKNYKPNILDGDAEAQLIALCCGPKPEGRTSWTLELLANKLIKLNIVDSISKSTIHRTLKKTNLSLG